MKICFYHSEDLDGKASGAIVNYFEEENLTLYPFDYGDEFPWELINKDTTVYMVDVSLPDKDMYKLNDVSKELIFIDHHISKIKSLDLNRMDNTKKILKNGKAACELTWEYFSKEEDLPLSILYLSLYDTWRHAEHKDREYILNFQLGLSGVDNDPEDYVWEILFQPGITNLFSRLISKGETIQEYMDKKKIEIDSKIFKRTVNLDGKDYSALLLNSSITKGSLTFEFNEDYLKADFLIVYGFDGSNWTFHIYSAKSDASVDCSALAGKFGGGGHKQAAGFKSPIIPDIFKLDMFFTEV